MESEREQPASTGNVLNERGVTVSASHLANQRLSYPLQAVTSASTRKEPEHKLIAIGIIVVGLALSLWSLTLLPESVDVGTSGIELNRFSDRVPINTLAFGIPGLALIIAGAAWVMRMKSKYTVVLHAPAGAKFVLSDRDEQWVTKVAAAVNEAIAAR